MVRHGGGRYTGRICGLRKGSQRYLRVEGFVLMSTGLLRRTYNRRGWVPVAAAAAMVTMIVFAAPLHAAQSLVLKSGESRTFTIPNKAPFTGLGDFRIEMRIHDFAGCDTTYANIWNFGAVLFRCHTAGSNMMQFLDPAAGAGCNLPFTGTSDMLVRFQRTLNGHMFCAIWSIEGQQISTYKSDAGTRSPTAIARS